MKKLLALVLCVMLFVSVIPTSAFAATGDAPSGISLYPVVQQANHFYGALIQYDVLSNVAGLAKGFAAAYPKLIAKASTGMSLLQGIFNTWNSSEIFDENTGKLVPPSTNLNYALAQVWWALGTAFVGDFDAELGNANDGTITGAIANAESKIPTVTFPSITLPA